MIGMCSRFQECAGRTWKQVLVSLVLTVGILIATSSYIDFAARQALSERAELAAKHWVDTAIARMPDFAEYVRAGHIPMTEHHQLMRAVEFGNVFRVKVFNADAMPVFLFAPDQDHAETLPTVNSIARTVMETGTPIVHIGNTHAHLDHDHDYAEQHWPDMFAEAYFPLIGRDGGRVGVVEVFVDETITANTVVRTFQRLAFALPILCAAIYLLLSVAFAVKAQQARERAKFVDHLTHYDMLTGALNRAAFATELRTLTETRDPKAPAIGLFHIDIDGFKAINDENGQAFGDAFLRHIADAIRSQVRNSDLFGRVGGDEFFVAVRHATDEKLQMIGQRMREAAREAFAFDGKTVNGRLSIGIHLSPAGEDSAQAMRFADVALYHAKASGRNCCVMFREELDVAMQRRRWVEASIRRGLEKGGFYLTFQAIRQSADNRIVGYEVLLRLKDENGEAISPGEFIPVAEEAGLITEIGRFVLTEALQSAKRIPDDLSISVNLSADQFTNADISGDVAQLLASTGCAPGRLVLEVTESLLLEEDTLVARHLSDIRAMGVRIAMDDFGTGYSSLGYLWKYEFDKIKIDRVFLQGVDFSNKKYRNIIETIVMLGKQLGVDVTLEGVETEAHRQLAQESGCDLYQGFLYDMPKELALTLEELQGNRAEAV